MSRLATSFVLGYHGCERSVGERAIQGDIAILQSDQDFDWLGPGAYFWESDPQRALEWARWKVSRGAYDDPFVVGAVIDLANCLDLVARENLDVLRWAHDSFVELQTKAGLELPANRSVAGQPDEDRLLRFLDCAVIRHLHAIIGEGVSLDDVGYVAPFDTVRGMFTEGDALYPGAGFRERSHTQIAVRNSNSILGLFRPIPYPL